MRFRTMWLAKYKFQNFIVGVAEIIDGAVKVVTLGFVGTHLSLTLLMKISTSRFSRKSNEQGD